MVLSAVLKSFCFIGTTLGVRAQGAKGLPGCYVTTRNVRFTRHIDERNVGCVYDHQRCFSMELQRYI